MQTGVKIFRISWKVARIKTSISAEITSKKIQNKNISANFRKSFSNVEDRKSSIFFVFKRSKPQLSQDVDDANVVAVSDTLKDMNSLGKDRFFAVLLLVWCQGMNFIVFSMAAIFIIDLGANTKVYSTSY